MKRMKEMSKYASVVLGTTLATNSPTIVNKMVTIEQITKSVGKKSNSLYKETVLIINIIIAKSIKKGPLTIPSFHKYCFKWAFASGLSLKFIVHLLTFSSNSLLGTMPNYILFRRLLNNYYFSKTVNFTSPWE